MPSKLDRDRARTSRKSTAVDHVQWNLNKQRCITRYQVTMMKRIEVVERNEHLLNAWQLDFIASIKKQVKSGRQLTAKQLIAFDKVYSLFN